MDIFFLQLVVLFIPGIIWERIDNRFGVNRPSNQFDVLRRSFCFGISSFVVSNVLIVFLDLILASLSLTFSIDTRRLPFMSPAMHSFEKDRFSLNTLDFAWIAYVSIVATALSIIWLYATNRKWAIKFMQQIGATKRFGDEDVWDFTFNSREASVEYVHVRDLDNDLNWSGWVELFSETGRTRELVLRDVEVTNIEGEMQYVTPRVYLARAVDSITIEFPYRIEDQPTSEVKDGKGRTR